MGILTWFLLGFLIGFLARFLIPSSDEVSFFTTISLGLLGAVVGGLCGSAIGFGGIHDFDLHTIATATVGALLFLMIYRHRKISQ